MPRTRRTRSDPPSGTAARKRAAAAVPKSAGKAKAGRRAAGTPGRTARGRPGPVELRFAPVEAEEVSPFVDLLAGAYPLFVTDRDKTCESILETISHRCPELYAGREADGRIVGGYALYDFVATIRGRGVPATGLGMVGTALDRKRRRVALQVVRDFVARTRERGAVLSFLYPFRHDFYGDMGWGAVGEARQYRFRPSSLPLFTERETVRETREPDPEVLDRIHRRSVGLRGALGLSRHPRRWTRLLTQAAGVFLAGPEDSPEGYLVMRFAKRAGDEDRFRYDLEVLEMDWTTPEALRSLLGFLSSQRDQVLEVVLEWPADGRLEALLREPVRPHAPLQFQSAGHGPVVGLGAMLRLEDPEAAFAARPCAGGEAAALEVRTSDPLEGGRKVRFRTTLRGEGAEGAAAAARLETDLATLARLWAGSIRASEASAFGLARITPEDAAGRLDRLLAAPAPWITERF